MKMNRIAENAKLLVMLMMGILLVACERLDIDDAYSRHDYTLAIEASTDEVLLDETTSGDVALTLNWSAAADLGFAYSTSYYLEMEPSSGSDKGAIIEYVAQDETSKSFTHEELQELLVDYWERPTGATSTLNVRITSNTEGPRVIIPEVATLQIKIKTFGPKPFLADQLFMRGTAVGEEDIEMTSASGNSNLFMYTGNLSAGTIFFPIIYGLDVMENAVAPLEDGGQVTTSPADIQVVELTEAGAWQITEENEYRVTINLSTKQLSIVPAGDVLDLDALFMSGTAVDGEVEINRALEDENVYAFRGELNAGTLYLPIEFEGERMLSIVPESGGVQAISDGVTIGFGQAETGSAQAVNHWEIASAGVYRIVVNIQNKDITIYSPETDLKPKVVSWNNTVIGQNPYTAPITELWMYGGFNSWSGDGNGFSGFHDDFKMTQSMANPNIFVYNGAALPRTTISDERTGESQTGSLRFSVSNIHNNVYAFGSTAPAQRNVSNGYFTVDSNTPQTLVEGQGDNRYAFFNIPSGTNFVVVDVENLTVVFDTK
ncbi:SusE domain-containing protein [Sphingobacterium sp. SGR-19]|uniref:SusE domain-containing protein n=1 Tax=Sphingobacterium sp. SGR-19 TaxID=2710886 RepID=UPI0013EB8059|nr:SusE domain-containing protein [Sphingobacterium sp. SGR-19]NGM66018.1 DUF5116 domain-containing protein [Sphingobacterium sp. SGR-19]